MWGVWIEIHYRPLYYEFSWVAPPHGERGLKYPNIRIYDKLRLSRSPPRGAWIEICDLVSGHQYGAVAPYAGSVG